MASTSREDPNDSPHPLEPAAKKTKGLSSSPSFVFTFSSRHAAQVKIQLLSTHTLYDLVDTLCKNVTIGTMEDETVDAHMWKIMYRGKEYETNRGSADRTTLEELNLCIGCELGLEYDYGSTTNYEICCLGKEELQDGEEALYPRRQPISLPTGYTKYVPASSDLNLDTLFPNLQDWIFNARVATINLFQPGRKKNFGFFELRGYVLEMMYLPVKPSNLTNWISYFDQGAEEKPDADYNWNSIVLLPMSKSTAAIEKKYGRPTLNDASVPDTLTGAFPKIAALAGLKKDANVPKGWITFVKKGDKVTVTICSGNSLTHKSNAPKGTAFDGDKQHDPEGNPLIVASDVEIKGLQDLFCVVEGLLRTL